jgi:hypothetical protein
MTMYDRVGDATLAVRKAPPVSGAVGLGSFMHAPRNAMEARDRDFLLRNMSTPR